MQGVPPIASRPRHARDRLLVAAAAILAGSVAVLAAADILGLVDLFETSRPAGFRIASGFEVTFSLILIPAFAVSRLAFLSHAERRARLLEIGATLAAFGAGIGLIGAAVAAGVSIAHHYPGTYTTGLCFVVAANFVTVFAALAASSGFSAAARPVPDALLRDARLMWAALGLAVSYGLVAISQVSFVRLYSDAGASAAFTAGSEIAIVGGAVALGAGVFGALGFGASQRGQRRGIADWVSRRDRVLGVALTAFAVAFLLVGLGMIFQASTGARNGFDSTRVALLWLVAAASIGNATASVCAAVGFSRSRRS